MTKAEYTQIIKNYIAENDIDFCFEITATDTATIDTIAEELTDTITADYPVETDEERDALVSAIYEVIRTEHAEEIKKGERIQAITKALYKPGVNIWDLYEELEQATPDELAEIERGVIK
jgi:polyribonucleotide nucleotidyltransferase